MNYAASQLRASHKSDLKKERTDFLLKLANGGRIDPPIDSTTEQSTLGFQHPLTARALVPIKDLQDFDADPDLYVDYKPASSPLAYCTPRVRKEFASGRRKAKPQHYPSFLYGENAWSPGKPIDVGLCEGLHLSRVR
jgi:hypothetical protein